MADVRALASAAITTALVAAWLISLSSSESSSLVSEAYRPRTASQRTTNTHSSRMPQLEQENSFVAQDSIEIPADGTFNIDDSSETSTYRPESITTDALGDEEDELEVIRSRHNVLSDTTRRELIPRSVAGLEGNATHQYVTLGHIITAQNPERAFMLGTRSYSEDVKTTLTAHRHGHLALTRSILSLERNYRLKDGEAEILEEQIWTIVSTMNQEILEAHIRGNLVALDLADQMPELEPIPLHRPLIYRTTVARSCDGTGPTVGELDAITAYIHGYLDHLDVSTLHSNHWHVIDKHTTDDTATHHRYLLHPRVELLRIFSRGLRQRLDYARYTGAPIMPPCNVGYTKDGNARKRQHEHKTSFLQAVYMDICNELFPHRFQLFWTPLFAIHHPSQASFGELAMTRAANCYISNGHFCYVGPGRQCPVENIPPQLWAECRHDFYETSSIIKQSYEEVKAMQQRLDNSEAEIQRQQHEMVVHERRSSEKDSKIKELETTINGLRRKLLGSQRPSKRTLTRQLSINMIE